MRFIIFFLGLALLLTGCSSITNKPNEMKVIEVGAYQAEDIPFEDGSGRATIVFEEPIFEDGELVDGLFDVIVLAKELDPKDKYEVSFIGDNKSGVIFGPEANVEIRFGTMVGDTLFQPNEKGELYVSMRNPVRVISQANEISIVVKQDGNEVLRTTPFVLKKK